MVAMDTQVLHNTVEQAGHRLTQTRQAVLRLIAQWPEGFTAEELSSELPSVGRATVYRTVKLLLDLGLVCKMARPDGSPRYTLASRGHHHHAICVRCGAVADFQQCTVDTIRQALQTETVGVVLGHRIEVYVLCPRCWEEEPDTSTNEAVQASF